MYLQVALFSIAVFPEEDVCVSKVTESPPPGYVVVELVGQTESLGKSRKREGGREREREEMGRKGAERGEGS